MSPEDTGVHQRTGPKELLLVWRGEMQRGGREIGVHPSESQRALITLYLACPCPSARSPWHGPSTQKVLKNSS